MEALKAKILEEINKIPYIFSYDPEIKTKHNKIIFYAYKDNEEDGPSEVIIVNDTIYHNSEKVSFEELKVRIHNNLEPEVKQPEKSGKELMSELHHLMTFLNNMGYDTSNLTIDDTFEIKQLIKDQLMIMHDYKPSKGIQDPFI